LEQFSKHEENGRKSQWFKKTPLKPPGKNMPFAFITSRLPFPQLSLTLKPKFETQDGAMLHEPIINCWRRIVNQTPDFPCREAAQFNDSLQATRDGRSSSASRFTSFGPACLSSERSALEPAEIRYTKSRLPVSICWSEALRLHEPDRYQI
jgi:hypothetical protein